MPKRTCNHDEKLHKLLDEAIQIGGIRPVLEVLVEITKEADDEIGSDLLRPIRVHLKQAIRAHTKITKVFSEQFGNKK